jgi:hypothetical protein
MKTDKCSNKSKNTKILQIKITLNLIITITIKRRSWSRRIRNRRIRRRIFTRRLRNIEYRVHRIP